MILILLLADLRLLPVDRLSARVCVCLWRGVLVCGHYVVAACTCFVVPPGNYGRTDTFSCRSCCCCCCFGLAVGPAVVALPLDAQPCRAVYACVCVCVCVCVVRDSFEACLNLVRLGYSLL